MSIFRLIRGELQKILLRPLMYIITIVLVVGLIGSVVLFSSTIQDRQANGYTIAGENKAEVYTNFLSNSKINKTIANDNRDNALNLVSIYADINTDPNSTPTAKLKATIKSLKGELEVYKYNIESTSATETDLSTLNQNRANLLSYVQSLEKDLSDATQSDVRTILMTQRDYDLLVGLLSASKNYLNSKEMDTNSLDDHKVLLSKLTNAIGYEDISGATYFDKLETLTKDAVTDVVISKEVITDLQTKHTKVTTFMTNVNAKIDEQLNNDEISLSQFKDTVLSYFYASSQYVDLVNNAVMYYPIASFSDAKINQMSGYSNVNTYELKQAITRDSYLIEHDLTSNTTAYVFGAGLSFSNTVSALDLVYFGLEICGFIIIVVSIILIASMIAGENARGTLRVQCLRPYSKRQILSSKIGATILLGFILLLFSAIVLFVAGWIMFGLDFTTMLAVFNATDAFLISPIAMIFVYLGLLMCKMIFYILFATMLATIFKNDIVAIIIPTLIYVLNAVLAFVFASTYWYAYIPFACVDLFKFFGGSFVLNNNPISIVLSTPLFYNTSFIYSICMFGGLMIIMTIISHLCFKKREIR